MALKDGDGHADDDGHEGRRCPLISAMAHAEGARSQEGPRGRGDKPRTHHLEPGSAGGPRPRVPDRGGGGRREGAGGFF